MSSPDVSVLLVSWNTRAETRRCVDSLLRSAVADGVRLEVIVVDNGSTDGSADMLAGCRDISLIRNGGNRGFAAAVNQAYARSSGELVLLLNSDVRLRPTALAVLSRFLRDHPDAAGAVPLYLDATGAVQPHYMRLPTFSSALALGTMLRFVPGFRRVWHAHLLRGEDFSQPRPVPQPSVSCMLLRRSALDPDHVFDERFPLFFNDVVLAGALADAGRELWLVPGAVVTHTLGASTRLLGATRRTACRLDGLIRYVRLTQPRHRVGLFLALVMLDRVVRRTLRLRGHLPLPELWATIRGRPAPLPDIDARDWVVMLSGVGWRRRTNGEHRQHAIAKALSGKRRVLFVDPPSRGPRWKLSVHQVGASLWHAVPPTLLPFGRLVPSVNRINRHVATALLRRWLNRHPGARFLWLDEDLSAPAAGRLDEAAVVYDAADLDWTFAQPWNRWHHRRGLRMAVRTADAVIASSSALPGWLPASRQPAIIVPNGCDPDRFHPDGPVTDHAHALPHPLLGYAGAIDTRSFDGELVAAVARCRQDWTFLLIGPSTPAARATLAALPNVRLWGPVDFQHVPATLRSCDVCLIPYRIGGLVDYVHPKKLYEYLALGKPVAATPLPALTNLDHLVHFGQCPRSFAAAVEAALESGSPAAAANRRAVATRHSWSARARRLDEVLTRLEQAQP